MKYVFDPSIHKRDIASRIVVAIDRVSEALRSRLWQEYRNHKLSPIQVRSLVFLLHQKPSRCTVTYISNQFELTKATVSDALASLEKKGLILRKQIKKDKRILTLTLTLKGRAVAKKVAGFASDIALAIDNLGHDRKTTLYSHLADVVETLHSKGLISIARLCKTCGHFHKRPNESFWCGRRKKKLTRGDLKIDCHDHLEIKQQLKTTKNL